MANPRYIKAVPGRKTDVKDAEWIADLLRHGLIRASFVPTREERELRDLVRYRKILGEERARMVTGIEKVLEGANVKLTSVASHIMSKSSRAMLNEMIAGNEDVDAMAELALSNLRPKRHLLRQALVGDVGPHQRFMLDSHLRMIDQIDAEIEKLNAQVKERMRPLQTALDLIDQIPGIGERNAQVIVAEIGIDMSRFETAGHLASWARLCPGNNMSAGKRFSGATGYGNPWLRTALIESALASVRAGRRNPNFFSARFHRIAARRGGKRAAFAVAHSILLAIYRMLKDGTHYEELGPTPLEPKRRQAIALRQVKRLEELGFKVTIEEAQVA